MRVRLLKSHVTPHAKYAIGTVINKSRGPAERMISNGEAEKYTGEYPPRKKMRTQFFKPK
jgi:hypothetical protein